MAEGVFLRLTRSMPLSMKVGLFFWLSPGVQILSSLLVSLVLLWRTPLSMLLYLAWIYWDDAPHRGGWKRCVATMRRFWAWHIAADYFPAELVKTVDLDPGRPYLFGYHPHGIMSLGALLNFGTEATGFGEKFPGVSLRVLGAKAMFKVPFFREWLLAHGGASVGRSTCELLLGRGESIMIIVGGAKESLEAHPDTLVLTIKERKGFVRVALSSGAALVPVLAFGENEIFVQAPNPKGSLLRQFQDTMLRFLGYTLPSFFGVGSFPLVAPSAGVGSFKYGLIPFRRPLTVVVGAPIDVPRLADPAAAVVDELHSRYVAALTELYEEHKKKCAASGHPVPSFVIQ